jgi:hypothetical protein
MPNTSIFATEWKDCLIAHYTHVITVQDTVTESSLRGVLLETGFHEDELRLINPELPVTSIVPPVALVATPAEATPTPTVPDIPTSPPMESEPLAAMPAPVTPPDRDLFSSTANVSTESTETSDSPTTMTLSTRPVAKPSHAAELQLPVFASTEASERDEKPETSPISEVAEVVSEPAIPEQLVASVEPAPVIEPTPVMNALFEGLPPTPPSTPAPKRTPPKKKEKSIEAQPALF